MKLIAPHDVALPLVTGRPVVAKGETVEVPEADAASLIEQGWKKAPTTKPKES